MDNLKNERKAKEEFLMQLAEKILLFPSLKAEFDERVSVKAFELRNKFVSWGYEYAVINQAFKLVTKTNGDLEVDFSRIMAEVMITAIAICFVLDEYFREGLGVDYTLTSKEVEQLYDSKKGKSRCR